MKDLLNKFDIVRVAAVHDQSSYKSENGIFLHEKLKLININIQEEMNAYDELFGRSLSSQHIYTSLYSNILSKADIILCTCSTSQRAVIRSVVSIKQVRYIFNFLVEESKLDWQTILNKFDCDPYFWPCAKLRKWLLDRVRYWGSGHLSQCGG